LPIFPELTDAMLQIVVNAIHGFCRRQLERGRLARRYRR
jgi:hypothetical protein